VVIETPGKKKFGPGKAGTAELTRNMASPANHNCGRCELDPGRGREPQAENAGWEKGVEPPGVDFSGGPTF